MQKINDGVFWIGEKIGEGFEWVGSKIGDGIIWLGKEVGDGLVWVGGKSLDGIIWTIGNLCKFLVTECGDTFIIFAMVGAIVYIAGGNKVGMKMIRVSVCAYLIMGIIGVII